MRNELINSILELSGDELDMNDLKDLCRETNEQLVNRLISIANWYKEQYSESCFGNVENGY
jgi:hypothetical protein